MNEHDMVEDTEQEEVSELDYPPEGELSSLMLMGFPSDRIYMVYDCGVLLPLSRQRDIRH